MVCVGVECEFSVCGAWAVVWGYLGPLGAGTALLRAVLVVLQAGTAVLNTPVSMLAEKKRPEVGLGVLFAACGWAKTSY